MKYIFSKTRTSGEILECEKWWIFAMMMAVGGYFGAFTFILRGGVFCNAQTANFVFLAISIGNFDFSKALFYLIPMASYLLGTMLSEYLPKHIKKYNLVRWETALVFFELIIVIILGFIPEYAPFQISQIAINFICSMQYNTFRQTKNIPVSTTFCTNHIRQTGVHIVKWLQKKDKSHFNKGLFHAGLLLIFITGATVGTIVCNLFKGKAIWGAGIILLIVFVDLLYADLVKEKGELYRIPSGHK